MGGDFFIEAISNEEKAVALVSERLALHYGYSPEEASRIRLAAEYHDIGKMSFPKAILNKPGKLTPLEFEEIKMHTVYGAKTLLTIATVPYSFWNMAASIAFLHHEKYNKKGYWGYGLSELPSYVGIVAVSDVYCALLANRVYKSPWTHDEAIKYIAGKSGSQFCPKLVDVFIKVMEKPLTNLCK